MGTWPLGVSLVTYEMGGRVHIPGWLEDQRRGCVKGAGMVAQPGEGEVSWGWGWQGALRPAGCKCRTGSGEMSIGARPATGAGDGSVLLPRPCRDVVFCC